MNTTLLRGGIPHRSKRLLQGRWLLGLEVSVVILKRCQGVVMVSVHREHLIALLLLCRHDERVMQLVET